MSSLPHIVCKGADLAYELRKMTYLKMLYQDQTWFDESDNSVVKLTNLLTRDPVTADGTASELISTRIELASNVMVRPNVGLMCWRWCYWE